MLWGWIRQEMGDVKETLHKARLTALHVRTLLGQHKKGIIQIPVQELYYTFFA